MNLYLHTNNNATNDVHSLNNTLNGALNISPEIICAITSQQVWSILEEELSKDGCDLSSPEFMEFAKIIFVEIFKRLEQDNRLDDIILGYIQDTPTYYNLQKLILINRILRYLNEKFQMKVIEEEALRNRIENRWESSLFHLFKKTSDGILYVDSFESSKPEFAGPDYILVSERELV
jgi:hypothetical protein